MHAPLSAQYGRKRHMETNFSLAAAMLLLPLIYRVAIGLYRPAFQKAENRARRPLSTAPELAVLLLAEVSLVRLWQNLGRCSLADLRFQLLFVMLAGMVILCMTDYWERVVPNRILLLWLLLFALLPVLQGRRGMETAFRMLPAVSLGLLFGVICFGSAYLVSRGRMGAGDVKLAMVMGLYLTGEYVTGAFFYACLAGALYAAVQFVRGRLSRKGTFPLVPFLFLGVVIRYLISAG